MRPRTVVTVEPSRASVLVAEGRIEIEGVETEIQLHVLEPSTGDTATLWLEGKELNAEIELHRADVTALIEGLREIAR